MLAAARSSVRQPSSGPLHIVQMLNILEGDDIGALGFGSADTLHLLLIGSIPDAAYMPQHICSVDSEEGGTKVAVRWLIEGHHSGYGLLEGLGAPTGTRLQIMGMTHYHYKNGKIVDEWNVYDELSLLVQVKLAQLAAAPAHRML